MPAEAHVVKAHASPSVRRFARELGVDLTRVTGTGLKGRITRDDVKAFVKAGGRMRLICSPVLSAGDHEALREGYTQRAEIEAGRAIAAGFRQLLDTDHLAKPAVVLASLVAAGVIDCQIACFTTRSES